MSLVYSTAQADWTIEYFKFLADTKHIVQALYLVSKSEICWNTLVGQLFINFNGMSIRLGLFYAYKWVNWDHCTFIFTLCCVIF